MFAAVCVWVCPGVLDFPADGQLIVTMYAGDCDILAANRRVTYSLSDVQFAFVDAGRGYELDERADERVATAFAVDAASGAVTPTLASYRPYSFGRFVLTVQATDSSGRRDASELKVGIACIYLFSYLLLLLGQKRTEAGQKPLNRRVCVCVCVCVK